MTATNESQAPARLRDKRVAASAGHWTPLTQVRGMDKAGSSFLETEIPALTGMAGDRDVLYSVGSDRPVGLANSHLAAGAVH